MLIFLTIAICLGVSVFFLWASGGESIIGFILLAFSGIGLFVAVIALPVSHFNYGMQMARWEAMRTTPPIDALNSATWRLKAAEVNADIAEAKFYNQSPIDIWIPDAVMDVKPIQ